MHLLSDILYIIIYHLIRYRRKVTRQNLLRSFPDKSDAHRLQIERRYYRHMCDLLVEGVHNLYASPRNLMQRYRVTNRELVNRYYDQGRSVVLLSSHYNNWEYMITTLNFQFFHHGVGVGKPLNNKRIHRYVTRRRTRFGTEVVDSTDVRDVMAYYHRYHIPTAYMMLSDQSPANPHRSYWTQFLNQDTAFLYGAEHFARKYNMPVLYYQVDKVRRGHYAVTFSLLCEDPASAPEHTITEAYARQLQATIVRQPEYWLWSHRRWKLTRNGRILRDGTFHPIDN